MNEIIVKVESIHIPSWTIFDQLLLYAKFEILVVPLQIVHFSKSELPFRRIIPVVTKLQIPSQKKSFTLVLHPIILNMNLEPTCFFIELNKDNKYLSTVVMHTQLALITIQMSIYQSKECIMNILDDSDIKSIENNNENVKSTFLKCKTPLKTEERNKLLTNTMDYCQSSGLLFSTEKCKTKSFN